MARRLKVGLHLPIGEGMLAHATPGWRDIVALARRAEEVGFDSLWIPDHLLFETESGTNEGVWECWSLLAALAAATERVELGPVVSCTGFRNPALLAKMADTVEEISDGRLILGLGAGWHEPEYRAFGYPYDHRVSRFEEALTIIHGLLREGRVDFKGTYYQAERCELRPRGPRPAGPPILIGTGGERMLRLTARYADIWNAAWTRSVSELTQRLAALDAACVEAGRDPATIERSACILIDLPGASGRGGHGETTRNSAPLFPLGTDEAVDVIREYADAGIGHLQVWLDPGTVDGIEAFAPVLAALRAEGLTAGA
ncbi:MAG: LLM class flavin-dependent oxidoreductase [Thermomicrobiales bacterium]